MARPITQISDGVIQAPLSTPQPSSALATPAQPAVVTSQPSFVDIPAIGPGIHTLLLPGTGSDVSATRTVVVSANASTTVVINNQSRSTRSSTTTGDGRSLSSGTFSSSPTSSRISSSTPTSTSTPSSGSSTNIGAIVGGMVGGLAILGIVVVAIFWIRRRHPKTKTSAIETAHGTPESSHNYENYPEVAYAQNGPPGGYAAQELEGRWNMRVELPAERK